MLAQQVDGVTILSMTLPDWKFVHPYLSYSDYILHTLGRLPVETTNIVKCIDVGVRRWLTSKISYNGLEDYQQIKNSLPGEVEFYGLVALANEVSPYVATFAMRDTYREQMREVLGVLPGAIRTFKRRVPNRFDRPTPGDELLGEQLFTWMIQALADPPTVYEARETPRDVSMGGIDPGHAAGTTMAMLHVKWKKFFPELFTVRKDPKEIHAALEQVIRAMASTQCMKYEQVRKVLATK